jgi:hypothetical protein
MKSLFKVFVFFFLIGMSILFFICYSTTRFSTTGAPTSVMTSYKSSSLKQLNEETRAELDRVWAKNQLKDGRCILAISSYGNRNMTLCWIISLKKNNYTKFIIFSFDQKLVDFLRTREYGNNSVLVPSEWVNFTVFTDVQDFRKGQFDVMMQSRVIIWYQLLLRNKTFVVSDTDLVFLSQHIYDHIKYTYRHSLAEVIFSQDLPERGLDFNTGFFYMVPTDFVKALFGEVITEIERNPNGQSSTD